MFHCRAAFENPRRRRPVKLVEESNP